MISISFHRKLNGMTKYRSKSLAAWHWIKGPGLLSRGWRRTFHSAVDTTWSSLFSRFSESVDGEITTTLMAKNDFRKRNVGLTLEWNLTAWLAKSEKPKIQCERESLCGVTPTSAFSATALENLSLIKYPLLHSREVFHKSLTNTRDQTLCSFYFDPDWTKPTDLPTMSHWLDQVRCWDSHHVWKKAGPEVSTPNSSTQTSTENGWGLECNWGFWATSVVVGWFFFLGVWVPPFWLLLTM